MLHRKANFIQLATEKDFTNLKTNGKIAFEQVLQNVAQTSSSLS